MTSHDAFNIPTLRLRQFADGANRYRVEIRLENVDRSPLNADVRFDFDLSAQDRENVRWYLEDYLEYPTEPAPTIAAGIERRMREIGVELFAKIFEASRDTERLWGRVFEQLDALRVEIVTDVLEATAIPWELLRDPQTDRPLALRARAFVRSHPNAVQLPQLPQAAERIRILLVICRPSGRDDVPFRSVASRLIKGLSDEARKIFELDVLRPPTFEERGRVLRQAKTAGQPYHVVHFDGHGVFLDVQQLLGKLKDQADKVEEQSVAELLKIESNRYAPEAMYPRAPRPGNRGYLVFENPQSEANLRLVDGPELSHLLVETGVPVLVLNACRSAHAETANAPDQVGEISTEVDPHVQVRALGSLAQEVMDAGVAGVVAMRYNVYVVTAAQFVADLYAALTQGNTLGEAVSLGRKQLDSQPLRELADDPLPLQDWIVPVVFEAAPVALFKRPAQEPQISITIHAADATPSTNDLSPELLRYQPDVGFFGRDETLLALDRAFDTQRIVLLHAYAGSGKTTTAVEFARWYALTGGVDGPILLTSFEQHTPLPRVLDSFERVFGGWLEQQGVHLLALNDTQRRDIVIQVLRQVEVLWIWDNVEPVAGFPAGTESAWSADEQRELVDFLRVARETKAKFLLTSRRDERAWLSDLPARIQIPPMPMPERVQLAKALAEKHGRRLNEIKDWRPLLRFTGGNPLTITVIVGQALRDGLRTRAQIEVFVAKLRSGEAAFEDEQSEGRLKSLGASLSYGFANAFTEEERKQLALLHFFQGFVDVDALRIMGNSDYDWCLPAVRGLTREVGIALLDRAAEIGLLTGLGGGYYTIHPALPWYFKSLFEQYYPTQEQQKAATRIFVEAIGALGSYYHQQYNRGNRDVIRVLRTEEANLLYARQLARSSCWWETVISTMQGVRSLYEHTGRKGEWKRLVDEVVPDFVNPTTHGPISGREDQWNIVIDYQVRIAGNIRHWTEAERLQRQQVDWNRQRAKALLTLPHENLDDQQRTIVRNLAASLHALGQTQRGLKQSECVKVYEESLKLFEYIGYQSGTAICAFNLGHAYKDILEIRDLAQAEQWYQRSLALRSEQDRLGRAKCLSQLGMIAFEKFNLGREKGATKEELLQHLNTAVQFYLQALQFDPPDHLEDLAIDHNALGSIYALGGKLDQAMLHWRQAIRYYEATTNLYESARTRYNIGIALAQVGRFEEALLYAQAALHNYETFGDRTAADIQKTQKLIAAIEEAQQGQGG